jgi:hypothetical protein
VTTPATPVELTALHELPPGTGRVHSVVKRAGETLLRLGYPGGLSVVVVVPEDADHGAEEHRGLRRPLAVRMTVRRASFECSVLVTSRSGPRRLRISTPLALRLSTMGVHTVLCTA